MLGMLFKQKYNTKRHNKKIAKDLYACALENTRKEAFYTEYGVPDNFDGRFDLLLLHIFLILHRIMDHDDYEAISQALFDVMFKDMDQTLREMGIGDVGVPKHMKRMMKAFNGRMYNYQVALAPESVEIENVEGLVIANLDDVLARNIYGGRDHDKAHLARMSVFVRSNIDYDKMSVEKIMNGQACFLNDAPDNIGEVENVG